MLERRGDQLGPVEEVVRDEPSGGADLASQCPQAQTRQAPFGDQLVGRGCERGAAVGDSRSFGRCDTTRYRITSVVM